MRQRKVLIATGASGGHINPALAIADELAKENVKVEFIGSGGTFSYLVEEKGYVFHSIRSCKFANQSIFGKLKALFFFYVGMINAILQMRKIKPDYVLGMGSYASIAAIIAAKLMGIKTAIHEQNVKPGRTNKVLMRIADKIFLSFEETKQFLTGRINAKNEIVVAGCPVEGKVMKAMKTRRPSDGKFRILIFGGSQGARILSDVVPQALITLPEEIKNNLIVVQQTRPEDLNRVEEIYNKFGINNELSAYFEDIPTKIRHANLIIGRSGAGIVCETAVLGRTAIFVPLLLADGHQTENARLLTDKNASFILETGRFTPSNLAYEVLRLIENPEIIKSMEENSKKAIPQSLTAATTISKEILEDL
ncbi:MAG: undecaprenyldiphospho-muramoylpentapeptide beta-N-acetylglucosaminyltransferase [Proteobacteria bacterium]|nr:undecaprenyldiphospho-muramoylpentapeptide beta-N-acetylglucosaminyltransferase [Pseudomonadota bacterium]